MRLKYCSAIFILSLSCAKEPDFDISCLAQKYSYEELALFSETGFIRGRTKRWNSDIKILVTGTPSKSDEEQINAMILELRPLLTPLKIYLVEKDGNVNFDFSPIWKWHIWDKPKTARLTQRDTKNNEITGAYCWIAPKARGALERKVTIRHEMMHALGFKHPKNLDGTIVGGSEAFNGTVDEWIEFDSTFYKIDSTDGAIIKILYDQCMPVGLDENVYKDRLRILRKNLGPIELHPLQ